MKSTLSFSPGGGAQVRNCKRHLDHGAAMNPTEISTRNAAGVCRFQGPGACQREQHVLEFIFDPSRHQTISTCLRCDDSGFIPLGPQPAIDFFIHRRSHP